MKGLLADRSAVALAVLLFAGLEGLSAVRSTYWPLFAVTLVVLLGGVLVALRSEIPDRGPQVVILPVTYLASVFLFHLYVATGPSQQLFTVGAVLGFILLMARATAWAYPTWTWLFTSLNFFLFASGLYGLTFHLRFPLWATALGLAALTGLLTYHVVARALPDLNSRLLWAGVFALLLSEYLLVLALFPVGYLAVGGVLFVVFYVLLHLLQRSLYDTDLPSRRLAEYVGLAAVAIVLILASADWRV